MPTFWVVPAVFAFMTWGWYHLYAVDQAQSGMWGCEMSWMMPSYVKIDTPDSPTSRYALYLYREVGWDAEDVSGWVWLRLRGPDCRQPPVILSYSSPATPGHTNRPGPSPLRPLDSITGTQT